MTRRSSTRLSSKLTEAVLPQTDPSPSDHVTDTVNSGAEKKNKDIVNENKEMPQRRKQKRDDASGNKSGSSSGCSGTDHLVSSHDVGRQTQKRTRGDRSKEERTSNASNSNLQLSQENQSETSNVKCAQTSSCDAIKNFKTDCHDFILKFEEDSCGSRDRFSSLSPDDVKAAYWPRVYDESCNVFHHLHNMRMGRLTQNYIKEKIQDTYIYPRLKNFQIVAGDQPFKTRVTTVDWHPRQTTLVAVGSKHGDVVFYRVGIEDDSSYFEETGRVEGMGPGGHVSALKFHPKDDDRYYTASLSGKVCLWNVHTGNEEHVINWFCSLDVHKNEDLVVSGRSTGWVYLQSRSGEKVWDKRLHKNKVTHAEFSPRDPAVLCTASLDHSVKLWDMRMINEKSPLACLMHDKGVNSAYFSLTDGCRLLTTDQFDDIRVYTAPLWHQETRIKHPHRFFQHLTPIKAYWHPVKDLIVVGRFPDMTCFPELGPRRVVDIYDAATGKHQCMLSDVQNDKILSLCKFNSTGEKLLTSMGFQVQLWGYRRPYDMGDEFMSEKELHDLKGKYGAFWESPTGYSRQTGSAGREDRKKRKGDGDDISKLKKKAKAEMSGKGKEKDKKKSERGSKSAHKKKKD